MNDPRRGRPGAHYLGDGYTRFEVWAPDHDQVELRLLDADDRTILLERDELGYHQATVADVPPGARYLYVLSDSSERPDPASLAQPEGVHGPSQVVDTRFAWTDDGWQGIPLDRHVIYELHTGTFTDEGTFEAIIPHLDGLKDLGVTTIELMPVAQFPGSRNWGYDGVYLYATQDSYGGLAGLQRLADACHARGMAIVLDVVYNHLGPEGNYLGLFGPYFTDQYKTPWGSAINFDGHGSDEVRRFFVENALFWVTEAHLDGLRLDAVHAIVDPSARPFLEEMATRVHERAIALGRAIHLIGETSANDPRFVTPSRDGGIGLDTHWDDDFHHALHVLLTGEQGGYYADYTAADALVRVYREGYALTGDFSPYRGRRHGRPVHHIPAERFVISVQNHDQVGNRAQGDRLSTMLPVEALKLAAAAMLLSPYVPMLFMGEEYGETAPFPYFVSHGDSDLVEAVRKGRAGEFAAFSWQGTVPDPQAEATFASARLDHALADEPGHRELRAYYGELLHLRNTVPALRNLSKESQTVTLLEDGRALLVHRWIDESESLLILHFGAEASTLHFRTPPGSWHCEISSSDEAWGGPGRAMPDLLDIRTSELLVPALSATLYLREETP